MLTEAKVENPPHSFDYTDADFANFFKYVANKQGKSVDQVFSKHRDLIKMLGVIPIATKLKHDLNSLPFSEIERKG